MKPYTYNYDNSEKYSNATPITESTTINGSNDLQRPDHRTLQRAGRQEGRHCASPAASTSTTAIASTARPRSVSQVSKFGIFRAGLWYEWADTNRHQYPSDPLNNWADQALPNFNETVLDQLLPALRRVRVPCHHEAEHHARRQVRLLQHRAPSSTPTTARPSACLQTTCSASSDPTASSPTVAATSAWLPSIDANYRLKQQLVGLRPACHGQRRAAQQGLRLQPGS